MEQRLAVFAAIGAGSHVTATPAVSQPAHEQQRQQQDQQSDARGRQPGVMTRAAPPADPDEARLLDGQGLMICLPDPLVVSTPSAGPKPDPTLATLILCYSCYCYSATLLLSYCSTLRCKNCYFSCDVES